MTEIGIVDTRNIIKLIQEKYAFDFSDYALTSFKRRLEYVLQLRNIKHPDLLLSRLKDNPGFFEQLLDDITIPSTEMFRDPSLWRLLRDEIIPRLYKENTRLKIWLPGSVSGDELYSLCIILEELEILDKVEVFASCLSSKSVDYIKSGLLKTNKFEISEENYQRTNGKFKLSDFLKEENGTYYRDTKLIEKVVFDIQKIELDNMPLGTKLILYRNKMIYFNPTLQMKVLKNLHASLGAGGYLVIGIKELLANLYNNTDFVLINQSESIYKKK